MRFQWFLFVFICLAITPAGYAAFTKTDSLDEIQLNEERYLLDPEGVFTFEDVKNKSFNASKEEALSVTDKLNPNRSVWIKIRAENHSNDVFKGVLYSNLCSERIYYWEENGKVFEQEVGFLLPHQDDIIFFDRYLLPITLQPGEKRTYYIKTTEFIRYIHSTPLQTYVGTADEFEQFNEPIGSSKLVNLHVFFNGFLIFQLFYILLQWFLVRRVEYSYYALYIISLFAYFWPRHVLTSKSVEGIDVFISHFVANCNDIFLILPVFFYFRFSRHFLDMPLRKPNWNKIIKYFEYFFLFLTVMIALTNVLIPNDLPKNTLILSSVAAQFILSIIALRGFFAVKTRLARFAITAGIVVITAHIAAMVISVFKIYHYVDIAPIAITMVAIIIEIAIFNSGLLFKARQFEKDKFRAQTVLLRELENKQKLQLEYEGVRDKISRDLHDDVGSTLSSVSIYSYAAKDKLAKGDLSQTRELLLAIEKNALSTLNSMGDLVWAISPQNDSTEKLLERISTFGYSILAVKDCKFDMEICPEFYRYNLNLEQRRSILLICKEALNNAAKYANANDICLKISKHNEGFRLELSDNGTGFDMAKINRGTGLKSMETRALTLSNFFEIESDHTGTTIRLNIEK